MKRLFLIILIGISSLFAFDFQQCDRSLYDQIHSRWKCDFGDAFFPTMSSLGEGEIHLGVNIAMLAFGDEKMKNAAKLNTVALASSMLTATLLKAAINRQRPDGSNEPRWDSSFPSGHTTAAFAMAYVMGSEYPKMRIPLYLFAVSVGISRIYVGRHYPADVLAGAALGTIGGIVVVKNKSFVLSIGF